MADNNIKVDEVKVDEVKVDEVKVDMLVNTAILEVSSNKQIVAGILKNLATVETGAFKAVVRCAYLLGREIPCGTTKIHISDARKVKSVSELAKLIGKARPTISRWLKAFDYVLENGYFDLFNTGALPFSFDKIIFIFDNELTWCADFSELMAMTGSELEKLAKTGADDDEAEAGADDEAEAGADDEAEAEDNSPMVKFTFNGQEFQCHENTLLAFIENECVIAE